MKEELEKRLMKFQLLGMASAFDNIRNEDSEILKAFKTPNELSVVMKCDDIAILKGKSSNSEDFPFTFARLIGSSWKSFETYFPTLDLAFLGALENKYDAGPGACFFASKVLNITK